MMFKGRKLELLSRGEVKREIDEVIKYITHESPNVPIIIQNLYTFHDK